MRETYFFDLPVYRLPQDLYQEQQERKITNQISYITQGNPNYDLPKDNKAAISRHQYEKYGSWLFNEIIRLHFLGSQIRGEYLSAEKKRTGLSRHKVFVYKTHKLAAEVSIYPTQNITSVEIFKFIQEYIADCKKELMKGRVIDDSIFMTVGAYIDWRALLGW
jgi:hypothetical protein